LKRDKTKGASEQRIPVGLNAIPKKERRKLKKPKKIPKENPSSRELRQNIKDLKERIYEAQETLRAIKSEIDTLFGNTDRSAKFFTICRTENPYRSLIEQMREGVVILSDDNTIIFCNNGFAQMMRSSIDRIIGKYVHNMIPTTHMIDFEELLGQSRTTHAAVGKEITVEANDHMLIPTHMSANTFEMDNISATFLVLTDLTERMKDKATGKRHA
jgi:PAS domain S-box-containing protein